MISKVDTLDIENGKCQHLTFLLPFLFLPSLRPPSLRPPSFPSSFLSPSSFSFLFPPLCPSLSSSCLSLHPSTSFVYLSLTNSFPSSSHWLHVVTWTTASRCDHLLNNQLCCLAEHPSQAHCLGHTSRGYHHHLHSYVPREPFPYTPSQLPFTRSVPARLLALNCGTIYGAGLWHGLALKLVLWLQFAHQVVSAILSCLLTWQ